VKQRVRDECGAFGSAALKPALDSGLDLAAGCCEAFAAAGDDAMRAGVAGFRGRGEAGFEGRLGFVVLLNLGECMEAWEVNKGIGANFVPELAGENCGIGMADSEGDEVSDVAEMRQLSIVKGKETRFLICPRMFRSIGDWSKAPTLFWIGAMASLMKRGS
jgi:hypothetical protein